MPRRSGGRWTPGPETISSLMRMRPAIDRLDAGGDAEDGRLARAGLAEEADDLAGLERQGEFVEHRAAAEATSTASKLSAAAKLTPAVPRGPQPAGPPARRLSFVLAEFRDVAGVERILVLAQRAVEGQRNLHRGRQAAGEQAGALELLEARQVGEAFEPEMVEEGFGGAVGHRAAGRAAAAAHPDPARFHQQVERALAGRDAADLFDLGAGRGLVVGDDRERFERGAAQRAGFLLLAAQQEAEVVGGAERPFVAAADEVDAAARIALGEQRQQRLDVGALPQMRGELRRRQRLGRGEQQRFEDAQLALGDSGLFLGRWLGSESFEGLGVGVVSSIRALSERRGALSVSLDCGPLGSLRRRMSSGPKARIWRSSTWPCRASSRLEAKVEAMAVARCSGVVEVLGEIGLSGTQSMLSPIRRWRISRASCSDQTVRSSGV